MDDVTAFDTADERDGKDSLENGRRFSFAVTAQRAMGYSRQTSHIELVDVLAFLP